MGFDSIISIVISFFALLISIIGVLNNEIWQKKNRKNDIKPLVNMNFVDSYTEGYVPQIRYEFDNKLGEDVQFYLKLKNDGLGMALNIKICYTNDLYQIMAGTFPLTIRPGDAYILTVLAQKITINNEFQIDVSYEDIDKNVYYVSSKGVYLKLGDEYRPTITSINIGNKKCIKPNSITAAKYIEEEI
jgi:hypothetical protein